MADDLTTVLRFQGDPSSALAALNSLSASLQRVAAQAQASFAALAGTSTQAANAITQAATAARQAQTSTQSSAQNAVQLAQATARLQVAQGNLAGAQVTLQNALAGVNQQTVQAIRLQTQLAQVNAKITQQSNVLRFSSTVREAGESIQQAGFALLGFTGAIVGVGRSAIRSAIDLDKQVNVLKAFTGSAQAAEKRLAELIATAQKTPGLTTTLAATLDAQLRTANVTEQTINKILPAIGKLNAVSTLGDPQQFARNLIQLVTQNFERTDLKELVGQSPLAGQLIKQVFNVDSPINSEAIRSAAQRLGIRTADELFTALAQAAATNPKLANVTESLGTQIEKLQDRIAVALRPLGLQLLETIVPAVERLVPIIEGLFRAFAQLPSELQTTVIAFGALAAALGPIVIVIGGLIQTVGAIGNLITVVKGLSAAFGGFAAIPALLNPVTLAIAGIVAVLGVAALAWASYETASERAAKASIGTITAAKTSIDSLKSLQSQAQALATTQGDSATEHERLRAIISQLDPDTRTYIETITDEKTQAQELNRVLKEQIALKQGDLSKTFGDIGDAAGELQTRIGGLATQLETLQKLSDRLANSGDRDLGLRELREVSTGFFGAPIESAEALGKQINETRTAVDGARSALANFGAQVSAYLKLSGLTVEEFKAQQIALGRTESQVNGAITAYQAFQRQQEASAKSASSTTSFIDQQRAAVDALVASIDRLNQAANTEVDRKIKEIALTAKTAAEAKAKLQQALALDDDFFFAVQERNRVRANVAALNNDPRLNPRQRSGSAARRVAAEQRSEASAELKLLRQIEQERELDARRATEGLKRALDDRLIDVRTYTDRAIAIDQELLNARLARLKEEEDAAVRSAKNQADADAKRHEVRLRAEHAILDSELRQEELRRQRRDAELRAVEEHERALADIREINRQSQEDGIREAASQGRVGAVEVENRLIEIERERFDERKRRLQEEFVLARANLQERQRINDELAKLAAERAAFELDASARIRAAQRQEAEAFTDFIRARVRALVDLRKAELDAQAAQTALAVQRGQLTRRDAEVQELERRRELIRIESLERQRAIEQQAADLEKQARAAQLGAAALVEIERQKNAALKAERDRANAEQQALDEQRRAVALTPGFGQEVAQVIAGIEQLLGRQLTQWEQLRVAIAQTAATAKEEVPKFTAVLMQMREAVTTALGASIAAFVSGQATIRQAAASFFAAALAPLKDFLLKKARAEFALALADAAILNFVGAAKHTAAGIALSAAAGLISGGASAIAGGGSVAGAALSAGGGSESRGQSGTREINQSTPLNRQESQIIILRPEFNVRGDLRRGVLELVAEDFHNNGQTRQMIRRDSGLD